MPHGRHAGINFFGRPQVGLCDYFQQGYARPVEVYQAVVAAFFVYGLACVFLHVDVVYAEVPDALRQEQRQPAAAANGLLILGELVALGHVRIKIIFAVKGIVKTYLTVKRERQPKRIVELPPIEPWECPGMPQRNGADMRIGGTSKSGRVCAEGFTGSCQLNMNLKSDNPLILIVWHILGLKSKCGKCKGSH